MHSIKYSYILFFEGAVVVLVKALLQTFLMGQSRKKRQRASVKIPVLSERRKTRFPLRNRILGFLAKGIRVMQLRPTLEDQ